MQIRSKFFDYYDSVGVGSKEGSFYIRDTVDQVIPGFPLTRKTSWFGQYDQKEIVLRDDYFNREPFDFGFVVFAGKLYPFVHMNEYYWSLDKAEKAFDKLLYGKGKKSIKTSGGQLYEDLEHLFSFTSSTVVEEWAIKNGVVTAMTKPRYTQSDRANKKIEDFTLNPELSVIGFQKIMDPYTAYQELDMWVGGVITNNLVMPDIADKHKIQQHGFDEWSFRKLPQAK